ncbi:SIR2 family protein [Oryzomicrobium sp.]|uniref:SIR2 family protein n=1 Tax=Oryzomicrobium sp. TaxID=1911578 RepID=UPI0025D1916F|nr:SIR2 family protein [Oryzomicrobium sp.]MCE1244352.1 SIR2 family protein [Oryzomicrobium sp.]
MRQLTIIGGAGLNMAISQSCHFADELLNFTYQKISTNVYSRINSEIKNLFSPESFDYILGGLLTINLAIEKTKEDLKRFQVNEDAFSDLFQQSALQDSIADALDQIERQLTISLSQMLEVVNHFNPCIDGIIKKYESINYFTTNFDAIFDHILYGQGYSRRDYITDFWRGNGSLNTDAAAKIKIHHLHGDLRYKPFKKTNYNNPPYRWPVLVVGDQEVKMGLIAGHESLRFYNNRLRAISEKRDSIQKNTLAIIGFGFRQEDEHIISKIKNGIKDKIFDEVFLYNPTNTLLNDGICSTHTWIQPKDENLSTFLERL